MSPSSLPTELEGSRDATEEDLKSLPAIGRQAVKVLERCIADHHIADVDYAEPDERPEVIRLRPAFINVTCGARFDEGGAEADDFWPFVWLRPAFIQTSTAGHIWL